MKTCLFCQKTANKRCEFTSGQKHAKKALKNLIWGRLGLHLGGFGGGFGRDLELLEASWAASEALFCVHIFVGVFKNALGGSWIGFFLDFEGFGKDFGRLLGNFWEALGGVFQHSGCFWAIMAYSG